MKSDIPQRIGVLDAITAGLRQAIRQPWLIALAAAIDLALWLAPQLTVSTLMQRFTIVWEALARAAYTPTQLAAMSSMLAAAREAMTQIGAQVNLAELVTGGWLNPPSALAAGQGPRLTFVSDIVLAPIGLSLPLAHIAPAPWQPAPVQITNFWIVGLVLVSAWLAGQAWAALYLRWAAQGYRSSHGDADPAANWAGLSGFLALTMRLAIFSFLLGIAVFVLRIPLGVAATLMLLSGGTGVSMLILLVGSMTLWLLLWFLTSFFFTSEGIVLQRQPLLRSIMQSLILVRGNGFATVGLVLLVNLIVLGFRAVWGIIGQTPAGAMVAILGNAYLATSMLLAVFTYYDSLRQRWQAFLAKAAAKKKPTTDGQGQ